MSASLRAGRDAGVVQGERRVCALWLLVDECGMAHRLTVRCCTGFTWDEKVIHSQCWASKGKERQAGDRDRAEQLLHVGSSQSRDAVAYPYGRRNAAVLHDRACRMAART